MRPWVDDGHLPNFNSSDTRISASNSLKGATIMNDELKRAVQKSKAAMQVAHPHERGAFKFLLLSNPNYFGNLIESPFKVVLPISGNTHYEELGCVGFHPQQERLEAVIYIYQPSGYGTDICGPGTTEYVRFYLSFDNGATWQDQGMSSFTRSRCRPSRFANSAS
jgi:hypothetical protein